MSRSGYSDDWDIGSEWAMIRGRGAVTSAFRGKRGQAFLKEMLAALDALPEKKLIANVLEAESGAVCAIGAVGKARGLDMGKLDPEDYDTVAGTFGIATAMAREIVYMNDDCYDRETPEQRFTKIREWIAAEIKQP